MSEAEEICGGLACSVFCGICCVAAAEENKRERECEEQQKLHQPIQVNPVPIVTYEPEYCLSPQGLPTRTTPEYSRGLSKKSL